MTVLIADDSPEFRRLIRCMVSKSADTIVECGDGSQAVAAYDEHRPDWVLMDVKMPVMDGITATTAIRASFPDARIVIVTQYDDDDMRDAAHDVGATSYVLKDELANLAGILTC